jgi:hypothetical protein
MFGERAGWRGPVVERWCNVRRDLEQACLRAGVPRVTPNDLRRTFASWLKQRDEPTTRGFSGPYQNSKTSSSFGFSTNEQGTWDTGGQRQPRSVHDVDPRGN